MQTVSSKYIILRKQYEILEMNGCFLWQKTLSKCEWLKWHECYFPQNEVASFLPAYILGVFLGRTGTLD